jgi:hypothetical protein
MNGPMHKLIDLVGSFAIALLLIAPVLYLPAQTVEGESLAAQQNHSIQSPASLVDTVGRSNATSNTLSCREGVAGWEPYLSQGINIQLLGGGHYLDFNAHASAFQPDAMEFIQVIRVKQNKDSQGHYLSSYTTSPPLTDTPDGFGPIIASAPGSLWLVGNEPDRGPDTPAGRGQDDTYPQVYAQVYHDVYQFIKQRDPTARVAVSGLVEVTPGRLQYLDIVWNTYAALYHEPMPVDVWNMHIYILPETVGIANIALGTDPALAYTHIWTHTIGEPNGYTYGDHDNLTAFDSQVRRMRQWMKDHGQQDKPLLLSEFSLLYGEGVTDEFGNNFTSARAAAFLTKTYNYLATTSDANIGMPSDNNRLVQQWVWFSVNHATNGYISNLITDTSPLSFTQVGQMFKASVAARPLSSNLLPRSATGSAPIATQDNTSVTATLSVQLANNGNRLVATPLTVTFYSNAALTEVINSTIITDAVPGCARRRVMASVNWPNLGAGLHSYWVKVDSSNVISEANEVDNVMEGQVLVGSHGVYLPLIARNSP